jgi:putative SOS response-associated peptidase YedK
VLTGASHSLSRRIDKPSVDARRVEEYLRIYEGLSRLDLTCAAAAVQFSVNPYVLSSCHVRTFHPKLHVARTGRALPPEVPSTFNARAETVAEKPMFPFGLQTHVLHCAGVRLLRMATAEGGKQPYFISAADSAVLSIAGFWDHWKEPKTGEVISSATSIVTTANDFTQQIHDRMPVILERQNHDAWLTGKASIEMLRPAPNVLLRM